jgi:hypothetical protein
MVLNMLGAPSLEEEGPDGLRPSGVGELLAANLTPAALPKLFPKIRRFGPN